MAHIKVLEGINAGKNFPLPKEVTLGRGLDNGICLPDARVSRRHARIAQHETRFVIEDLQSANGTLLRDSRLFPGTPYNLCHGDKIKIGSTLMVFMDESLESKFAEIESIEAEISESEVTKCSLLEPENNAYEMSSVLQDEELSEKISETQENLQLQSVQQQTQPLSLRIVADSEPHPSVAACLDASIDVIGIDKDGRQTEGLHDTVKRLQAICQVSMALGTITDQSQLMQKIVDCIFDIFPDVNRSFILLREPCNETLIPVVVKQNGLEKTLDKELVISQTIVQEVITHKHSILSVDTMGDSRFNQQASVIDLSIRSMMCVPLLVGEELLGLIQVDIYNSQKQFTPEDLQILTGIGTQAAIAVKNTQLYQQVEAETARRTSLQRYFSSKLVEMLMSDDVTTTLGGNSYRGTILFADIIGFTTMSEAISPAAVLSKLNRYLTVMQKLIHENGGNIDKVNGDSIMAFWGVPQIGGEDESNAVFTAIQMQRHLWSFNLDLQDEEQQPIHMGIGLNTGEFIAGNIGSEDKIEFTLIGDNVNLASRIEHLAGRNQVLVSEATWQPIKHLVSAVQLPPLLVRGKSTPITIYSIRSMQNSEEGSYIMALQCHLLDDKGRHVGRGIITGGALLNTGICLRLSTQTPLVCGDLVTLQMEAVEYHKPLLCILKVHSALTATYNVGCVYTQAVLTDIQDYDEELVAFITPGNCVSTTYTWNDLKRR